jgi:hypothetical protein
MRLLNFIVVAGIGLALLQAAAKLAALLVLIVGIAAFVRRPQESIGCVCMLLVLGLVGRFPVIAVVLVAILFFVRRFWPITDSRDNEPPAHDN